MAEQFIERQMEKMSIPDVKSGFYPQGRLYEPARAAEGAAALRGLLSQDVQRRGLVLDTPKHPFDPQAPFIVYEPMNKRPESGMALLFGRLVASELSLESGEGLVMVGVPRAGGWLADVIAQEGVLPGARVAKVTKDSQRVPFGSRVEEVEVLSYAHKRQPDGSRGKETVYFVSPRDFRGRRVVLFDDVIAEGETAIGVAGALLSFGASRVDMAAVLSKEMQGGSRRISDSGAVDGLVVGVAVSDVLGPGRGQLVI